MNINWERVELFVQGFLFRASFLVSFVLFIGVFVYAYYTEVGREDIGDTAPFATGVAYIEESIEKDTVDKAHRTRREMQVWLVERISEFLNVDAGTQNSVFGDARALFTAGGYAQYQDYLKQGDRLAAVEQNRARLSAIVDQTPLLLNDGVIGGKYRWLFDVPVIVTITPLPASAQNPPQNQKSMLRVQLARTEDANNPHKLVIESWQMHSRR